MQANSFYSKIMAPVFDEKEIIVNSTVFQTIFNSDRGYTIYSPSSKAADIDIIRGNERTAKLKVRGTNAVPVGGNQTTDLNQRYTSLSRLFPLIEQDGYLTADQFNNRVAGEDPFKALSQKQRAIILASQEHAEAARRIIRKQEVHASQAFRTGFQDINEAGTITLDYLRNALLTAAAASGVWSNIAGDATGDLLVACNQLRAIGRVTAKAVIMNNGAFMALVNQTAVQALADNRRLSFHSIGKDIGVMPSWGQKLVDAGAQWQGWIKIGAYHLDIFTYIDTYETDAGVITPYVPVDEVYVWDPMARYDRYFGPGEMTQDAIDAMVYKEIFGVNKNMVLSAGLKNAKNKALFDSRQFTLGAEKKGTSGYKIITQSAPMYVPCQTDTIYTLTGVM